MNKYRIAINKGKPGDFVLYKGKGLVFTMLSFLLGIFDKKWRHLDWKPWHTAVITYRHWNGYEILESTDKGVRAKPVPIQKLKDVRIYRWLDNPDGTKINKFASEYYGRQYDVSVYFWTMSQYLILHYFNHSIPRVLNKRYSCWELVFEFTREMGSPLQSLHTYPMITDFLRAVGEL